MSADPVSTSNAKHHRATVARSSGKIPPPPHSVSLAPAPKERKGKTERYGHHRLPPARRPAPAPPPRHDGRACEGHHGKSRTQKWETRRTDGRHTDGRTDGRTDGQTDRRKTKTQGVSGQKSHVNVRKRRRKRTDGTLNTRGFWSEVPCKRATLITQGVSGQKSHVTSKKRQKTRDEL